MPEISYSLTMYRSIRVLCIGLIIVLLFASTGCSFSIPFNIRNLSDQAITVIYSLKDLSNGFAPRLKSENRAEDGTNYIQIPQDRISIDTENRVVEFKLLPNGNVELYSVHDKLDNQYEEEFNLTNLHITGVDGTISLTGREIFKSFRPIKKSWYVFGPEITGFVFEYR